MAMNERNIAILNFVKEHEGENITAEDIAIALNFPMENGKGIKQVNGIITQSFQLHKGEEVDEEGKKIVVPLMKRVPGELAIEEADGSVKHKEVKFIKMTEEGRNFIP